MKGTESMPTLNDVQTWKGRDLYGAGEDKIGEIADVYLDRRSGEPEWIAVKTGFFGMKVSFVPIRDASDTGETVTVPFDKDKVKDAPKVDADGELSPEEERRLYDHYGHEWGEDTGTTPEARLQRFGDTGPETTREPSGEMTREPSGETTREPSDTRGF